MTRLLLQSSVCQYWNLCMATPLPTTSICLDLKRWFGCEEVLNPWDSGGYLLEWLFGSISTIRSFMVRLCTLERVPKWARGPPLSSTLVVPGRRAFITDPYESARGHEDLVLRLLLLWTSLSEHAFRNTLNFKCLFRMCSSSTSYLGNYG